MNASAQSDVENRPVVGAFFTTIPFDVPLTLPFNHKVFKPVRLFTFGTECEANGRKQHFPPHGRRRCRAKTVKCEIFPKI